MKPLWVFVRRRIMYPFIDRLAEVAEKPGPGGRSLADRLRDSYDAHIGTYDGFVVDELIELINALIRETPEEEVRAAYNALAEQEGLAPLEEDEILLGPYTDMFIDPVLKEIGPGTPFDADSV
jgi:hypothetical protein